jgi:competence protein ComEC
VERVIIPLLDFFGIDKIDYGFISHMDADHYSGFVSLIHEGKIGRIYKPLPDSSKSIDIKFEQYARRENIPVKHYQKGVMPVGGVKIKVLSSSDIPGWDKLSTNNKSALIKIEYGSTSFLFTGDIEHTAENYYLAQYGNSLKTDILKVSHHGSLTATSEKFLQAVKPGISLISAGIKNKFRLPSPIILQRLKDSGSLVRRTDIEGGVLYQSDGKSLKNINWKEMLNYQD